MAKKAKPPTVVYINNYNDVYSYICKGKGFVLQEAIAIHLFSQNARIRTLNRKIKSNSQATYVTSAEIDGYISDEFSCNDLDNFVLEAGNVIEEYARGIYSDKNIQEIIIPHVVDAYLKPMARSQGWRKSLPFGALQGLLGNILTLTLASALALFVEAYTDVDLKKHIVDWVKSFL